MDKNNVSKQKEFNERLMDSIDDTDESGNIIYDISKYDNEVIEVYIKDRKISCDIDIKEGTMVFDIPKYGIDNEKNRIKYILRVLGLMKTNEIEFKENP